MTRLYDGMPLEDFGELYTYASGPMEGQQERVLQVRSRWPVQHGKGWYAMYEAQSSGEIVRVSPMMR